MTILCDWRSSLHFNLDSPIFIILLFNSSKFSYCQPSGRYLPHICNLGAKVGCKRISEHSTCSD
ncbi:hypothetical protein DW972_01605 [Anaerobutyricum hallii]|uniref:Uncharacterized protein n=1 Tax=Anaerobutyricum hallii TaxID=39488 RepID=A0A413Q1C1_9FIRM|nr:hypothetical protein DW972_01605 [Anaerobutyricum hallii]